MKAIGKKEIFIGLGVILILVLIYYLGKRAGKDCGWMDKLLGNCPEEGKGKTVIINTGSGEWLPNPITDALYTAINRIMDAPGAENDAFGKFNVLSDDQKVDVINDWAARYEGTDKAGWFTGNFPSLKKTLEEDFGDMEPNVAIAYNWMITKGIE